MDFEETRRLDLIGYDEKTETWYLQSRDSRPLQLTRPSLQRLVQLYNSIHKGNTLVLLEQREVRRLEETRQRHSAVLRDLYLFLDRKERRRPLRLVQRFIGATLRLISGLFLGRYGNQQPPTGPAAEAVAPTTPPCPERRNLRRPRRESR